MISLYNNNLFSFNLSEIEPAPTAQQYWIGTLATTSNNDVPT